MSRLERALGPSLVAFALIVHLPALGAPRMLDDNAQKAMVEGRYPFYGGSPFNLYDFINEANRDRLYQRGIIPWWTKPGLVIRFLRPLSSALVWLDHEAFGGWTGGQHLHSLVWWAIASAVVYRLYRRAFSVRVARLGALVFALCPCHAVPLVWIANREVLLSTALGTAGLFLYSRWREGGRSTGAWAALALFALAMSAGEYTLCFGGYVLAIEIVRRRDPLVRRVLGLSCFALPAFAYLAVRSWLRYGAHGSGFYLDPTHDFAAFVAGAPRRLAVLVGVGWFGLDDVTWSLAPLWAIGLFVACAGVALAWPLARAVRELTEDSQRTARWLLLGSFLSLGPVLAVEPFARVLPVAMVGIAVLVALVIDRSWFPPAPEPRRGVAELASLMAVWLGFAHLVHAPVYTWLDIRVAKTLASSFEERMDWVKKHVDGHSTVVVLHGYYGEDALFAPLLLGADAPERWRLLTWGPGRTLLLRTGPRTIDLVASPLPLFQMGPRDLFRNTDGSLGVGASVKLDGMRATVVQLDDHGLPRRLKFEFDRDLEDPSFLWLMEGPSGFREQKLPPDGFGDPLVP